jgi:hypothetical protein
MLRVWWLLKVLGHGVLVQAIRSARISSTSNSFMINQRQLKLADCRAKALHFHGMALWECHHVSLNALTAPPLRSTRHDTGTAGAGGWWPRKGPYCVQQISRGRSDSNRLGSAGSERVVGRADPRWLPVRCGGQVVRGACVLDLAAAEWLLGLLAGERSRGWSDEAPRRFVPAGKARAGSASSQASCRPAVAGHVAVLLSRSCSSDW